MIEAIEFASATQLEIHRRHLEIRRRYYPQPKQKPPAIPAPQAAAPPVVIPELSAAPQAEPKFAKDTIFHRIHKIQMMVCWAFKVKRAAMLGHRRMPNITEPRHIAMAICRAITDYSLPEIGRRFHRDHTTAIHAVRKYQWLTAQLQLELPDKDLRAWTLRAAEIVAGRK